MAIFDHVLSVCEEFGWSDHYVTHEMPVHRFWACLDYLRVRNHERRRDMMAAGRRAERGW